MPLRALLLAIVVAESSLAASVVLRVDSYPSGAAVSVGGEVLGVTPFAQTVEVGDEAARTITVTLRMEAYNDAERSAAFVPGGEVDLGRVVLISPYPLPPGARPVAGQQKAVMDPGYAVETTDGAVMVWVPPGEYHAGYPTDYPDRRAQDVNPYRLVRLDGYWIDRDEVTNARYKAFIDATGHDPPPNWTGTDYPIGRAAYPVTHVTVDDAYAYARWARKRLPTEEQWEKAARGADDVRLFPWGDDYRTGLANVGRLVGEPRPVGSYEDDVSPYGVRDMAGNVRELVLGEWKGQPQRILVRGGGFGSTEASENPAFAMIPWRGYIEPDAYARYLHLVGFRCVVH